MALVALLFAAEAQAYKSGGLIWAKKIGTSASEASAWSVVAGPNGTVAIAGWQHVAPTGQVPMVAKFGPSGLKWKKTYATAGYAEAVACDRSGNVYVAATITRTQARI
ncbi:MAG TPA: hypothetical protein VJ787_10420 [Thermoleophilia bacterium]|nr:hypothetical protein [Thermoleophilia bacterium]